VFFFHNKSANSFNHDFLDHLTVEAIGNRRLGPRNRRSVAGGYTLALYERRRNHPHLQVDFASPVTVT
jgi:hypothetical protein